ncbi:uncharacterized protein LOC134934195, partial [Pseudophryne corroboree]|uniref:uncharacterized protein LOC134934195 n=1 Tax=Pseudophryne corroboree TaxID=495146 RepID=UPI0030814A29
MRLILDNVNVLHFHFHSSTRFPLEKYLQLQTIRYAMNKINSNPNLLPNISLGFQIYDSCRVLQKELECTLWMITGQNKAIPNFQCQKGKQLAAVIGYTTSTFSILMAHILRVIKYPQVSHVSTSSILSDKTQFPFFLRTAPSDVFQSKGLAQLVSHFNWTWVGMVADSNDYGYQGIQGVKQEILKSGACVEFMEYIQSNRPDRNIPRIIRAIKMSRAKVMIVFASDVDLFALFGQLLSENITQKIWVASEGWATSSLLSSEKYLKLLIGTVGFAYYSEYFPGFHEFIDNFKFSKLSAELWDFMFWEDNLGCALMDFPSMTIVHERPSRNCTKDNSMEHFKIYLNNVTSTRLLYNLYSSIYVIAKALHDLSMCVDGKGPFTNGGCSDIWNLKPWQNKTITALVFHLWPTLMNTRTVDPPGQGTLMLITAYCLANLFSIKSPEPYSQGFFKPSSKVLTITWLLILASYKTWTRPAIHPTAYNQVLHYMKKVRVKLSSGRDLFFDEHGDPPPMYDVVNWHMDLGGNMRQVKVGYYNSTAPQAEALMLNTSSIQWKFGDKKVPISVCSNSCPVGFRKTSIREEPSCCYECAPCSQEEISNDTDSTYCFQCPWNTWPSGEKDRCLPKPVEYLSFEETLGITLASTSVASSFVPIAILGLLICYKTTPIVRANNYTISCLLLISLCLCFLCSLAFIGYPQPEKCLLRQVTFAMAFALCVSCILAKTILVMAAFRATKPNSDLRRWASPHTSYLVIGLGTLIQFLICGIWLIISPPFPDYNVHAKAGILILECNEGSPTAFWLTLGYLSFLAVLCCIAAFLARQLPDSFNEAKFITFSMVAFLSVWLCFIPASLSTSGKYTVVMEIFAVLSSSWSMLGCMFAPKCYVVLFHPSVNSRKHLLGKTVE